MLSKIREFIDFSKNKRLVGIIMLLLITAAVPLTVIVSQQQQEIRQRAAEFTSDLKIRTPQEKFAEGEVLVKFKTTAPPIRAKKATDEISILSFEEAIVPPILEAINQKYKIKTIEKIFKKAKGQTEIPSAPYKGPDLSRIYKLELNKTAPVLEVIEELKKDPSVEYAELNYIMQAQAAPDDPFYPEMWNLSKIQVEDAWDITKGSNDVIVAVLDTGIDYTHQDLGECLGENCRVIGGYDFAYNDSDPMDVDGHGTHVAGTIAATVDNGVGISGINWNIKMIAVKVLDDFGFGPLDDIVQGIQYATDNQAKVINMSLGARFRCGLSQILQDTISYSREKGVSIVVSAGNSESEASIFSLASCTGVIVIGATGPTDERSYYSNYGPYVDLSAPGGDMLKCSDEISCLIHSTYPENQYMFFEGTSMATPHAAGVAALLLAKDLTLTPDQIETILKSNGDPVITDDTKPVGKRLNAINSLVGPIPTPGPPPPPTPIPQSPLYSRVFLTSTLYNGDVGGLSGADAKCREKANAAELGGDWKAWITDSLDSNSPNNRFYRYDVPYKLLDGTIIASNWSDLTNGLLVFITLTEKITSIEEDYVWTNTDWNGEIFPPNDHCNNWTSSDPSYVGKTGNTRNYGAYTWTDDSIAPVPCDNYARLYCFEQPEPPTPTASPTATPTPTPSPTPTPTPSFCTPCRADINKDGIVDSLDSSLQKTCLNKKSSQSIGTTSCAQSDLNGDGTINTVDTICVSKNFNIECPLNRPKTQQ